MADGLYDTDFVAWTEQQASMLRARGAGRTGSNAIDWDQVAEEIEHLGRSETRACESFITNILLHFLKLQLVRDRSAGRYWRAEITAFRIGLAKQLTPSLGARLPHKLPTLYADALRLFRAQTLMEERLCEAPDACPWTFDDVQGRGEDWLPEALPAA